MATTTPNLGMIKPAGTDKIRIAQINSNMDTLDAKIGPVGSTPLQTQATNAASSISALQNGMAIVCNGNTHAEIASGSYAYVRNHSSLAEGLYQATTAIAANDTLSSSNLVAVSGGGLNALNGKLSLLEISSGTVTEVQSLTTSGTYLNYTVPTSGWYTVRATTANTSGSGFARIAVGNTVIMHVSASLGQYDLLLPAPLFLKKGTAIKAMAGFPANGGGSILKIA